MFVCAFPSMRVSVKQFNSFSFEYLTAKVQLIDRLNFLGTFFSGLPYHINHTPCVTGRHTLTLDYYGIEGKFCPAHENFIKF